MLKILAPNETETRDELSQRHAIPGKRSIRSKCALDAIVNSFNRFASKVGLMPLPSLEFTLWKEQGRSLLVRYVYVLLSVPRLRMRPGSYLILHRKGDGAEALAAPCFAMNAALPLDTLQTFLPNNRFSSV